MKKQTRIIYTDEAHLETYDALPPSEFKEFFMKLLRYKKGDEIGIDSFSTPVLYAMFAGYKCLIDDNETRWEERAAKNKECIAKRWEKETAQKSAKQKPKTRINCFGEEVPMEDF
jgi:hypothetical protein